MLDRLWLGECAGHRCIVGIKDGSVKHHWVSGADEHTQQVVRSLDEAGWDVYFAPAAYQAKRRLAADAVSIPALWLDLDCGPDKAYPTQAEGLRALRSWIQDQGLPTPSYIVSSGYGLHIYWCLDHPCERDVWLPVAKHLKQAASLSGLRADPTRTADSASILRVPGTHNHKDPSNPLAVKVLLDSDETVDIEAFRASLPAVGPQRAVPSQSAASASAALGEWAIPNDLPPGDAEAIGEHCQQIREMRDTRGKVSEPLWRACLSVLKRCINGDHYIHEWSKGDPRYDAKQTQAKADATGGPSTCEHFAEVNPGGCVGCPFAGTVRSPIMVGMRASKEYDNDVGAGGREPGGFVPILGNGYKVLPSGVWTNPISTPPEKLISVPLWVDEVRSRARLPSERGQSSLVLRWQDSRGRKQEALLDQEEFCDPKTFGKWLAAHNLLAFVSEKGKLMSAIKNMTAEMFSREGERLSYDALGWVGNGPDMFVLGTQAVTTEGLKDVVVESSNSISNLKLRGDKASWVKAANMLGRPEYQPHAFALLAALSAPLLQLGERNGAVVALAGESGKGKTLAARFGLSAFVSPDEVMESGHSTVNAIEMRLEASRHVPVLVDEVTSVPIKRLAEIIYIAANGTGKGTLDRNRKNRKRRTWRTVTLLTSNHSLMDRAQDEIEEAHRRRLLEVPVDVAIDRETALALVESIRDNHGAVAEAYLGMVFRLQKKIPALFDLVQRRVENWAKADEANRFVTWTLSGALLAGLIARLAGLIDWDPVPVVRSVIAETKDTYDNIIPPHARAHDTMMEFLTAHSKHVCRWPDGHLGAPVDDPVARITDKKLYVHRSKLNREWADKHINHYTIRKWMEDVITARRKLRLAPGTMAVWAYEFDLKKLDVDVDGLGMD